LIGLVTQPDKPAGRDQHLLPPATKSALADAGSQLPVLQPPRIKAADAIAQLRGLTPDVIVVMAYGQILSREILEIPALACLNLHASLLPRWRGAAPIQAAIAHGEMKSGITVMYMNEGLDTGDILLARETTIAAADTGGTLHDRLGLLAPAALFEALSLLRQAKAPRIPQDESRATHAPKLSRDAGVIHWSEAAEIIERKVRAFHPWPGAYTTIRTSSNKVQKLKIFSSTVAAANGAPGQILSADEHGLIIATGRGALSLGEVQLEGRQRMTALDFLRGTREVRLA
jgi:methionyl-tRNA formyltransferase